MLDDDRAKIRAAVFGRGEHMMEGTMGTLQIFVLLTFQQLFLVLVIVLIGVVARLSRR